MANIQLLQETEMIKDSYTKINTSVINLNNAKMEKTADSDLNMNGRSITNIARQNIRTSGSVLTISNGAITVTQSYHVIDTENGAPTDELDVINGGSPGDILILRQNDANRDIIIRNQGGGVGNIRTFDWTDIKMEGNASAVMLIKAGDNWVVIGTNGVKRAGDTMTGRLEFSGNQMGLRFRNGNSDTSADFIDFPEASTANVIARLFRFTNTSGNKQFSLARGDGTANPAFAITNGAITCINNLVVTITAYAGNPNGNVAAPPGSICLNTAGGAGASIYVKESGTGNTGWVAK